MLAVVTDAHFVPARSGTRQPADPVVLTGADLTIADVEAVARHGVRAALDLHARDRMQEARDVIDTLVARGEVVYGVTTGFGDLATTFIPPGDAAALQENLIASHAAGVGSPFPREVVRAMLLLRANTLALGHSGCRPELVDFLCRLLCEDEGCSSVRAVTAGPWSLGGTPGLTCGFRWGKVGKRGPCFSANSSIQSMRRTDSPCRPGSARRCQVESWSRAAWTVVSTLTRARVGSRS